MDLHSESGTAGRETIIADSPEGKALAQSIFQSSVQLRGEDGAYQHIRGLVKPTDVLGKRKGSLVVEEAFATANFPFMLRAAFLERAADKHARGSFVHEAMRQWLRDAYFPQTISYKTSSLSKGVTSFNSAWNYLST
ncbi:hypothetical protein, unlikely [Trypanosoma congolense IL3000]|nr:hypothetical protein, unlikely [Trypanosoma congolense IL3000]